MQVARIQEHVGNVYMYLNVTIKQYSLSHWRVWPFSKARVSLAEFPDCVEMLSDVFVSFRCGQTTLEVRD